MNQIETGKFIATLRKEKNLTQEQLGEILGVNARSISRWENGHCMPDLSLLELIADTLDISISELLKGRRMNHEEIIQLKEQVDMILNLSEQEKKTKTQKMNHYFKLGSLFFVIILLDHQFNVLSYIFKPNAAEFVTGALTGLGIVLELVGLYNNNHDIPLRQRKKIFFHTT